MDDSKSNPAMDQAAQHARDELLQHYVTWDAVAVSRWWKKWYSNAGHRRLGRVLLELTGQKHPLLPLTPGESSIEPRNIPPEQEVVSKVRSSSEKIGDASALIEKAEKTVLGEMRSGRVKDEEAITERLLGAISQLFNDHVHAGVLWSAMTLTAHKRNAQETEYGADLLGVLNVNLEDFSVNKGFLIQAKHLRQSEIMVASEFNRLKEQCSKMLNHTSASYVFLYRPRGIYVLPALEVRSLNDPKKFATLKPRRLTQFFKGHFDCFVGDHALNAATDETLESLRERVAARTALLLSAKPAP